MSSTQCRAIMHTVYGMVCSLLVGDGTVLVVVVTRAHCISGLGIFDNGVVIGY